MGKIVVGVTGLECTGKTVFVEAFRGALEAQGNTVATVSTEALLDEALAVFRLRRGYEERRKIRQGGEHAFGDRFVIGAMLARIDEAPADVVIWDGVRTPVNVREITCKPYCAHMIVVVAEMDVRVTRLTRRCSMPAIEARAHLQRVDTHQPLALSLLRHALRVHNNSTDDLMVATRNSLHHVLGHT